MITRQRVSRKAKLREQRRILTAINSIKKSTIKSKAHYENNNLIKRQPKSIVGLSKSSLTALNIKKRGHKWSKILKNKTWRNWTAIEQEQYAFGLVNKHTI